MSETYQERMLFVSTDAENHVGENWDSALNLAICADMEISRLQAELTDLKASNVIVIAAVGEE